MRFGIELRDAFGNITFDSTLATGGVCLGLYVVPSGGGSISFPDIVGTTGIVIATACGAISTATIDNTLGYLRFTFPAYSVGQTYVLFAK